jgi:alkanesulfonate monooxygenase SsuD/methylene tetrahydromethanopterin reductase-like flavin-dependent oxidoreductase (luciferase family)
MKFGVVRAGVHAPLGSDHRKVLLEYIDSGVQAERLGFWSLWVTEHHFGSDRNYRPFDVSEDEYRTTDYDLSTAPIQGLTYLAAKTSQLRLGTAVVITHWDHPVRIAEKGSMLDNFSNGRLELGVGRGAGFREIELYEVPSDPAVNNRRYHEAIEIIRGLWSGEPFNFEGEFYRLPKDLILVPKPVQQPAPIWVGSASLESAGWAAEQHLPYATITWPLTALEMYRKKIELFRSSAAESGYDITDVGIPHVLFFYCGESDDEAFETGYKYMTQFQYIIEQHYENMRYHGEDRRVFAATSEMFKDLDGLARFPIDNHIIGGPETCIERIEWFRRELGVNYILLNIGWGVMPHEQTISSMERFAREVMPHFSGTPALAGG